METDIEIAVQKRKILLANNYTGDDKQPLISKDYLLNNKYFEYGAFPYQVY